MVRVVPSLILASAGWGDKVSRLVPRVAATLSLAGGSGERTAREQMATLCFPSPTRASGMGCCESHLTTISVLCWLEWMTLRALCASVNNNREWGGGEHASSLFVCSVTDTWHGRVVLVGGEGAWGWEKLV